jgi:hypothetical protein
VVVALGAAGVWVVAARRRRRSKAGAADSHDGGERAGAEGSDSHTGRGAGEDGAPLHGSAYSVLSELQLRRDSSHEDADLAGPDQLCQSPAVQRPRATAAGVSAPVSKAKVSWWPVRGGGNGDQSRNASPAEGRPSGVAAKRYALLPRVGSARVAVLPLPWSDDGNMSPERALPAQPPALSPTKVGTPAVAGGGDAEGDTLNPLAASPERPAAGRVPQATVAPECIESAGFARGGLATTRGAQPQMPRERSLLGMSLEARIRAGPPILLLPVRDGLCAAAEQLCDDEAEAVTTAASPRAVLASVAPAPDADATETSAGGTGPPPLPGALVSASEAPAAGAAAVATVSGASPIGATRSGGTAPVRSGAAVQLAAAQPATARVPALPPGATFTPSTNVTALMRERTRARSLRGLGGSTRALPALMSPRAAAQALPIPAAAAAALLQQPAGGTATPLDGGAVTQRSDGTAEPVPTTLLAAADACSPPSRASASSMDPRSGSVTGVTAQLQPSPRVPTAVEPAGAAEPGSPVPASASTRPVSGATGPSLAMAAAEDSSRQVRSGTVAMPSDKSRLVAAGSAATAEGGTIVKRQPSNSVIRSALTRGRSSRLPWLPAQAAAAAMLAGDGSTGAASTMRTERLPDGDASRRGEAYSAAPASVSGLSSRGGGPTQRLAWEF